MHFRGAMFRTGRLVLDFARLFGEPVLQMDDNIFMGWMLNTIGVTYYTAFRVNVIGRRSYNFLPAESLPFRRALRRFFGGSTPTIAHTIARFRVWEPRRGVAAYLIWALMH